MPRSSNPNNKTSKTRQPKKEAFLVAYAACGNISQAAKLAKCHRSSHRDWLADPEYAARFAEAHEDACDSLETEARRRAVEGVDKPVYQGGKKVGTVREYSDTLLIFLMKGAIPDKYRERLGVSGEVGVTHSGRVTIVEDGNWYGNGERLSAVAAEAAVASSADPALAGTDEVAGVRTAVGQDGNGDVSGD